MHLYSNSPSEIRKWCLALLAALLWLLVFAVDSACGDVQGTCKAGPAQSHLRQREGED